MSDYKWFAVCTRQRWEKKVVDTLTKKKITSYCPLNERQPQTTDRKKIVFEPLFPSYVFVKLNEKEQATVLHTPGVTNFVYWLNQPVVIRNEEIAAMMDFMNIYSQANLEKAQVEINGEVRYINGPVMTRKGNLLEVKSNTVKVMLPSLGHVLVAEIRKENSEKFITVGEENLKINA